MRSETEQASTKSHDMVQVLNKQTYLVSPLMFAKIARVGTRKLAEATLVRLLSLMQRTDVSLQLCVCRSRITAPIANVRSLAGMCPFMVVLCLIRCKRLVAAYIATCVGTVAGMTEQVTG